MADDVTIPPGRRGLRPPAPTAPRDRVLVGWPTMKRIEAWRNHLGAARDAYAIVVRALAEFEDVLVVADEGEGRAAEGWLGDGIDVIEISMDDSWLRDTGPTVLTGDDGTRVAVQFGFNGWGGRMAAHDCDTEVATNLAGQLGIDVISAPFVLEGGAVVFDGAGTVIATESCVLNPNRNGAADRTTVEGWLADWLGAERVIWLPAGLADDWGTDGHVHNLVAFCDPTTVLLQTTTDAGDPDWHNGIEARRVLEEAGLRVVELDVLPHVQCFDQIVEVPYVNLYVGNEAVFVPLAGAAADHEMLDRIGGCFPGRKVVGVPGTVLAYGGGGVRSLTCPVPAALV